MRHCVKCDIKMVNRYSIIKITLFLFTILGLFSPWLVHYYDPYTAVNPDTNMGEKRYHSMLVLSPFYVSLYQDGVFQNMEWFPSFWTIVSAIIIIISALTGLLSEKTDLSLYIIVLTGFAGFVLFFLSLSSVNLGWKNFISWGLWVTFIGLTLSSFLSFFEISKREIPLLMNNK